MSEKLNQTSTGLFLRVKWQKEAMKCKCFMEGGQEI